MVITFVATTELPLHQAILIGAITSLVLYCVKASQSATLVALRPAAGRRLGPRRRPRHLPEQRGDGAALCGRRAVRRGAAHRRAVAQGDRFQQCRRRVQHGHDARRAVVEGHPCDPQVGHRPRGQWRPAVHRRGQPRRRRRCSTGAASPTCWATTASSPPRRGSSERSTRPSRGAGDGSPNAPKRRPTASDRRDLNLGDRCQPHRSFAAASAATITAAWRLGASCDHGVSKVPRPGASDD